MQKDDVIRLRHMLDAVVIIATDMLTESRLAFSARFALATAVKAAISPLAVPSSPSRVAIFENSAT